jgi:hypothetical protein
LKLKGVVVMLKSAKSKWKKLVERWRKTESKWKRVLTLALVFLMVGFFLGQAAGADSNAVPGSESDPLVTASWVEAKLDAFSQALKDEQKERQILEDRMQRLEGNGTEKPSPEETDDLTPGTPAPTFQVIIVASGEKMLTGTGTEFILRSGNAKAVEGSG